MQTLVAAAAAGLEKP